MTAPLEQLKAEESDSKKRVGKRGGLSGFTGEKPRRDKDGEKRRKAPAERIWPGWPARGRNDNAETGDKVPRWTASPTRRGTVRDRTLKRKGTNTAAPRKEAVVLELPCTVRSFCEAAGVPVNQVLRVLMGMQMMININSEMELETAEMIAAELDLTLELKQSETLEDELITELEEQRRCARDAGHTSADRYLLGSRRSRQNEFAGLPDRH